MTPTPRLACSALLSCTSQAGVWQQCSRGLCLTWLTLRRFDALQLLLPAILQDVYERLTHLCSSTRRSVLVLAATGMLSAATLMQLSSSGHGVGITLHGKFTILSLSGALLQVRWPSWAQRRSQLSLARI